MTPTVGKHPGPAILFSHLCATTISTLNGGFTEGVVNITRPAKEVTRV